MAALSLAAAHAQSPDFKNIGRAPSADEIRSWDTTVGIAGKELPPGKGTAKEGAALYAKQCAGCHGASLEGSRRTGPPLVGGKGSLTTATPIRSIGAFWPYATTLWDYINRAMPRGKEGSLQPDEVYALSAFIFFKNDIIKEDQVLDEKSLPKIQMPNRNNFIPQRLEDIPDWKKRNCRLGICP